MSISIGFLRNAVLICIARYIVAVTTVYVAVAVVAFLSARGRRQRTTVRPRYQILREFSFSLVSAAIFATILSTAIHLGIVHLKPRGTMSTLSISVAVGLLIILHDAWFYWTHRLLHLGPMFRFHRLHHRSVAPTVWTAYSFHPIEAFIHALFPVAMSPFVPLSIEVIGSFMTFMVVRNALGHSGVEVFPADRKREPLLAWSTTVTHHDLHHELGRGNYGLYFTFWDRVMKTETPRYVEYFQRALRSRTFSQKETASFSEQMNLRQS